MNKIRVVDNLSQQESFKYIRWSYQLLNPEDKLDWESEAVQLVKADILDRRLAEQICQGADVIVHLAANTGVEPSIINPHLDCETNVIGTLNYLEAAKKNNVKKFVFASSGAPAGEVTPPIHEDIVPKPISPYGASKLAGEAYCSAFYHSFGVETVALRFSNVYGPLSKHKSSVVAKFINHLLNHEQVIVYGDGTQTRDYIYVQDLVQAIIMAGLADNIGGELFQVATGKETSILQLITLFNSLLGSQPNLEFGFAPSRLGDMKRNYADIKKIQSKLNWSPEITLEQGLEKTLRWFGILSNSKLEHDAI